FRKLAVRPRVEALRTAQGKGWLWGAAGDAGGRWPARSRDPPVAELRFAPRMSPPVFVITGPSGVGKGTLIRLLRERVPELALSVSATTRQARPGETQGEHYHFISDDEFARHVADGDFVEWAEYSGRRYGTLRDELDRH